MVVQLDWPPPLRPKERVILLERDDRVGGILNQQVHDGFGTKVFKEALTGPEYAAIYEDRVNEREVETWLKSTVIDPS